VEVATRELKAELRSGCELAGRAEVDVGSGSADRVGTALVGVGVDLGPPKAVESAL
jgi:hypothetical protein